MTTSTAPDTLDTVHAQLTRGGPNFKGRIRDVIKALRGENEKTVDRAVGHLIGCCKGEMIFRHVALKEIKRLDRELAQAQATIREMEKDNKLWHANWEAAYAEKKAAETKVAELTGALYAITTHSRNGEQLCFKTANGVPMGMSRKQERIVQAALNAAREKP